MTSNINAIYLVLGILFLSIVFYACNMDDAITSHHFNQQIWKAMRGSLATENPRRKMVDDLKANYLKTGIDKSEVLALLGHADRINNHQHLYRLGMREFSVDYSYLTLIYDAEGRLMEIRYAQA